MNSAFAKPVGPLLVRRESGHRYNRVPRTEPAPKASENEAEHPSSPPSILDLARKLYGIKEVRAWFPHLTPEMEADAGGDIVKLVAIALPDGDPDDLESVCDWLQDHLYIDHPEEIESVHGSHPCPEAKAPAQTAAQQAPSGGNRDSESSPLLALSNRQKKGGRGAKRKRRGRSKRPVQEVQKMHDIIDAHDWLGMLTLRLPTSFTVEDEARFVEKLCRMLSDRFRADGLDIGSLIKREFGKRPRRALHYHILFTSPNLSELPDKTLRSLLKAWLRIVQAENNQPRYFDWRAPHDGQYLKKLTKSGQNVISIPSSYGDINFSPHLCHTRGLGRNAGLGSAGVSPSPTTHPPAARPQSPSPDSYPVSHTPHPNWSPTAAEGATSAASRNNASEKSPCSCDDPAHDTVQSLTQNETTRSEPNFTHPIFSPHTKQPSKLTPNFTQTESQEACATCEYHGRFTPVTSGHNSCPVCHNEWDVCCPF